MFVKATLLSSHRKRRANHWCLSSSPSLSVGCCPVRATGGSLPCGRYLFAPLTGNKEESKCLTVLRVKPTRTRFLTDSRYTPMDNTPLHSISSVCHPWSNSCRRGDTARRTSFTSIGVPMIPEKKWNSCPSPNFLCFISRKIKELDVKINYDIFSKTMTRV